MGWLEGKGKKSKMLHEGGFYIYLCTQMSDIKVEKWAIRPANAAKRERNLNKIHT